LRALSLKLLLWGLLASQVLLGPSTADARPRIYYRVRYDVTLLPSERGARVAIELGADAKPVEWIRLKIDPSRHLDFSGDGEIVREGKTIEWRPPRGGGILRYFFLIDHRRDERTYDARCAKKWALFRGDDLVPPARVRTSPVARSRSRLRLRLPEGWTTALPYPRLIGGEYQIQHVHRRFDRPTGWMIVGKLGVIREEVAGIKLAVAGPEGHRLRRLDILALLSWTLPTLVELLGDAPSRLLVVGAGDPMWRGGLSGPQSAFIHADRPLLTEDGTSPLLHEVVHALLGRNGGADGDWIAEGLAEVYALEALVRSGTLSRTRYDDIKQRLAARGRAFRGRLMDGVDSGDARSRAITLLYRLDSTLKSATGGSKSLDDVLRELAASRDPLETSDLRAISERIAQRELPDIFDVADRKH
jgi:hypothetical protein